MPINVTGTTDTTGAVSVLPGKTKVACIVAQKGTSAGTAQPLDIFDVFGTVDATNKWGVGSKAITLAEVLITNGVTMIKGILVPDVGAPYTTVDLAYDAAFDKLMTADVDVLVLDATTAAVLSAAKDHLDTAEDEDKFRYLVTSADGDDTALTSLATSMNNKRVFVAGPVVTDRNGVVLSGIYAAAGVSALICTETTDPALPMSGVEMVGFGAVSRVTLKSQREALVTSGVTPLYTSPGGRPTVYRLVTTYTKDSLGEADPTWQEGTTVMIADDVLASVQARIRTNYKRTKQVTRILNAMRTDVIDVLRTKNELEIIENFDPKSVSVVKDPQDVYGALIDYDFDVVTPLYTVKIRQHMKL